MRTAPDEDIRGRVGRADDRAHPRVAGVAAAPVSVPASVTALRPGRAAPPVTLRRYRPGVYPATVETIRLSDGRSVRTDLIRLHPNVECYSLDLEGAAPRQVAHYTITPWATAPELTDREPDVGTILRASYPAVGLTELSARLRDDGHPLGTGNLRAHEAIAATQAALWQVTNGVDLDTRPVAAPVATAAGQDGQAVPVSPGRPAWVGAVTRERGVRLELTLAARLQVGSYSVGFTARSQLDGVRVSLERSPDGSAWTPVPSSTMTALAGTRACKVLGVGATLADGRGLGYAHYRVAITTESPATSGLGVEHVSLTPAGVPAYPNPDRVVHLYRYLVGLVRRKAAPGEQVRVCLAGGGTPTPRAYLVGPIRVQGVAPGQRFGVRAQGPGAYVVDADGNPVFGPVTSTDPVFLRLPRRRFPPVARVAVTLLGAARPEPRLLFGAPSPGAPPQFAPVVGLFGTKWEAASTFPLDVTQDPDRMEGVD